MPQQWVPLVRRKRLHHDLQSCRQVDREVHPNLHLNWPYRHCNQQEHRLTPVNHRKHHNLCMTREHLMPYQEDWKRSQYLEELMHQGTYWALLYSCWKLIWRVALQQVQFNWNSECSKAFDDLKEGNVEAKRIILRPFKQKL